MLLAIDVGNTDTKLGVFALETGAPPRLARTWRVGTAVRTGDEFGILVRTLFRSASLDASDVEAIAVSSVVPQGDPALARGSLAYFGCEPAFFSASDQDAIAVATDRPRELGADLLASGLAARARFGAPVIVVGFGTATTYGAVGADGTYLGAAIAPGIRISIDALVARTAKLPQVALEAPPAAVGRDTVSALQSGIVFGFVGQTEAIVARMRAEIGANARVIATGGLAGVVAKHTDVIDAVEPHLVLEGLALWHAAGATGKRP